jgi:hypothetical protein
MRYEAMKNHAASLVSATFLEHLFLGLPFHQDSGLTTKSNGNRLTVTKLKYFKWAKIEKSSQNYIITCLASKVCPHLQC